MAAEDSKSAVSNGRVTRSTNKSTSSHHRSSKRTTVRAVVARGRASRHSIQALVLPRRKSHGGALPDQWTGPHSYGWPHSRAQRPVAGRLANRGDGPSGTQVIDFDSGLRVASALPETLSLSTLPPSAFETIDCGAKSLVQQHQRHAQRPSEQLGRGKQKHSRSYGQVV
jgi:hypothetical protein